MQKKLVYPAQLVNRKPPVNYADMADNKTSFIRLKETINSCELIEINNAYISPFGVVFKNGLIIKESVYSMFKPNSFLLSFFKKIFLNKVKKIKGTCVVAHHSYYQNYYHFLLEILPRLFLVKEQASTLKLIINKNIPSFVREYIELFNFKEIVFIEDTEVAFAEKLVFPSYSSRGLAYNETIINEMSEWLRSKLFNLDNNAAPKKIFISREKARYRNTINEEEVFAILEKKGFVKFNLDEPSIKSQANFFKNAEYIVGSHGAGFSNMIYSPNCKLVVDIIHENHPQDCFYNLANVFDIDYYYFQCKGTGKNSYANNDDINVDLFKFEQIINQYIPE